MGAASRARWIVLAGVIGAVGCGESQQFLAFRTTEQVRDQRIELENGCLLVMGERGWIDVKLTRRLFGADNAGLATPDEIVVERVVEDLALQVTVRDGEQGFSQMGFGRFFDSEDPQRFHVVSAQGRLYDFVHRSVFECDGQLFAAD